MLSTRGISAGLAAAALLLAPGVLAGPAAAAKTRSCGSAGGFNTITATGVTCRYATQKFIPKFQQRSKVLPRGWTCTYKRGGRTSASCRWRRQRITWRGPSAQLPGTGLKEYRVYADLEVALPPGTTYTLQPFDDKCVNDRIHGPFTTTSDDEKTVLWMDASESFYPACWSLVSYVRWDFRVDSPFTAHQMISLGQGVSGGAYKTGCEEWYLNSLKCEETTTLGLKISG